jgi:TetR/AcrR family transcriptional repressor of lmrAB and yxaGH operons
LRRASADAFASWVGALEARLHDEGLPRKLARRRALLVLAAIEGALVLARAQRDTEPLLAVREELLALAV